MTRPAGCSEKRKNRPVTPTRNISDTRLTAISFTTFKSKAVGVLSLFLFFTNKDDFIWCTLFSFNHRELLATVEVFVTLLLPLLMMRSLISATSLVKSFILLTSFDISSTWLARTENLWSTVVALFVSKLVRQASQNHLKLLLVLGVRKALRNVRLHILSEAAVQIAWKLCEQRQQVTTSELRAGWEQEEHFPSALSKKSILSIMKWLTDKLGCHPLENSYVSQLNKATRRNATVLFK